jgi:hypothetical protein
MATATATATLDAVIPIVFPNYEIKVSESVSIPAFDLPKFNIGGRSFGGKVTKTQVFDGKISDLGHAGVLILQGGTPGKSGTAKYFEYGRYDPQELGIVRPVEVPNILLGPDGRAIKTSLEAVLAIIAKKAGHGTRIAGAYIEAPGKFKEMKGYADFRYSLNKSPKRTTYAIMSYSCLHFMRETAAKSGKPMPEVIDPSPAGYIDRIRAVYPELDYDPKGKTVKIEDAAEVPDWAHAKPVETSKTAKPPLVGAGR